MTGKPGAPQRRAKAAAPSGLRHPPVLAAGDSVAFISPSSHQGDAAADLRREAAAILAGWGLRVVNADEPETQHLYFAADDARRAAQFESLYCDPAVKALFFTRGGYGAARMLPLLDGPKLAAAPEKLVVGFSDATALFAWLHTVAGVSVLHGPCVAAAGFLGAPPEAAELEALRRALFEPGHRPAFSVNALPGAAARTREVEGVVLGGSLAVLVTVLGTPWEPDTRGAILFLEDVNEAPYRIDRMLTHLRTAGKFEGLGGIVFGHFRDCDGDPPGLLDEVLRDLFRKAPFPVATGLPAGHGTPNLALPLGRKARLTLPRAGSGGAGRLEFMQ